MTLIVGLNLSNHLHLAADSRATTLNGLKFDNIIKIIPIYGEKILNRNDNPHHRISMAVAGDVSFATFLHKEIQEGFKSNQLQGEIRVFSITIKDFIKYCVEKWLGSMKKEYRNACLLFAGANYKKNKKINTSTLTKLVSTFQENSISQEKINNLIHALQHDQQMIKINRQIFAQTGKGILQTTLESSQANLPKHLYEALITKRTDELVDYPDTLLTAILIRPAEQILEVQIAEWGEFLAFGSNRITKNDLPPDLLATIELSKQMQTNENSARNLQAAIIKTTILETARKQGIDTIGGTVLIHDVIDNDVPLWLDGNKCEIIDKNIYYKTDKNILIAMKPFYELRKEKNNLEINL